MKGYIKTIMKTWENYITLTISRPTGDDVINIKIYCPKLIMAAMLFIIFCGVLLAGFFIGGLIAENNMLKTNNVRLHDVNHAQQKLINENQREIEDITINYSQIQEKAGHLASMYSEIVEKYKEITEKYILDETSTLPSRGAKRDDKGFVTDLINIRNKILELSSIQTDISADNTALLDTRKLLDGFAEALPDFTPVQGRITDRFGERIDPFTRKQQQHKGLDIAAPYGSDIMAAGKGKVVFAGRKGAYGNLIIIEHGYGIITYYAHASKLLVEAGQEVNKGEVIARIGSTGRSTAPHLHFEVRINNEPVDPLKYITVE